MELTDSRKTTKKIAVGRRNLQILGDRGKKVKRKKNYVDKNVMI